jgi:hypothetical protein
MNFDLPAIAPEKAGELTLVNAGRAFRRNGSLIGHGFICYWHCHHNKHGRVIYHGHVIDKCQSQPAPERRDPGMLEAAGFPPD